MRDTYPELHVRRKHILETTRAEEERFLATIDAGMTRFEEMAPESSTQGSSRIRGTISGEDAFRLYDTFGFPIDLTELMPDRSGLDPTDAVLNGIAWDPEGRRLFVTGKNWPKLFEIRLTGPR
jgi:alanyl-tRNA synthetase